MALTKGGQTWGDYVILEEKVDGVIVREKKSEFTARLKKECKYALFVKYREELKLTCPNMAARWYWLEAAKKFPKGNIWPSVSKASAKFIEKQLTQNRLDQNDYEEAYWTDLTEQAKGRNAPLEEKYNWVFEHIHISPENIDQKGVPSVGAVSLLRELRRNPALLNSFVIDLGRNSMKQIGQRGNTKAGQVGTADGGSVLNLLDQFEEKMREGMTDGDGLEPVPRD